MTVLTHDTDRRVRPCPEPGCRRPLLRQWRPVPSVEPGSISRNTDPTGRETGSSSRCGRNRRRSPCPPGNGGGRRGARERMSLVAHDVTIASKTRRSMPRLDPERGGWRNGCDTPTGKFLFCGNRWKTSAGNGGKNDPSTADPSVLAGDRTTRVSFTGCGRMWTTKTQGVERRNHTGVTLDIGVGSYPNTTSSGRP